MADKEVVVIDGLFYKSTSLPALKDAVGKKLEELGGKSIHVTYYTNNSHEPQVYLANIFVEESD